MSAAYAQNDRRKLTHLLPQAKGHPLEPWAAYWELRVRLGDASDRDIKEFLTKYAGTYQEDRLRTDWLLVLAQRQEWTQFEREFALYRMHDDKEVECYANWLSSSQRKYQGTAVQEDFIRRTWLGLKNTDEGCTYAFEQLLLAKRVSALDAWRKARSMVEINRKTPAKDALHMVSGQSMSKLDELMANPLRFLQQRASSLGKESPEWITMALVKMAANDHGTAAKQLQSHKSAKLLNPEQLKWVWAVIGRQAAMDFDNKAVTYFESAGQATGLNDDLLAWMVRAALRAEGVAMAIVDAVSNDDLLRLGPAMAALPLLTAGSGLAIGLPANFGLAPSSTAADLPAPRGLQAVVSGSCSAATNAQVLNFIQSGRPALAIDPLRIAAGVDVCAEALAWAQPHLASGPVLIYSTAEPRDVKAIQGQLGAEQAGAMVERTIADIARGLVARGVQQLVVAGGETSGACVQALGIAQMRIGPQIDPGVPWCHALPDAALPAPGGLHITLKSGNFGTPDFFTKAFRSLVTASPA